MKLSFRPVPTPLPLSDTRILLVEDDLTIRTALCDLLSDDGSVVTAVTNGLEALAELRRSAPPDVIVLDLMMPVMDGWEFRAEQKNDPVLAGIPVVAMSADLSAKARAIAADAYVRKPIDLDELRTRIRSVVDHAAKRRLAAADRMAALGTLASGIAHEINNPLTYVMANLQMLRDRLPALAGPEGAEARELLTDAMEGVERIKRIVMQAQLVAPSQPEERETVVDLRRALETALAIVGRDVPHPLSLVRDLAGEAPIRVRGDRGRVEQLFVNLLRNAVQAVAPEEKLARHEVRVALRSLPSERALVEIIDTGRGIPAELQERIFQPFFTTRPIGQGTGLGLAICLGIITALGGEISFESEPDRGTIFRVMIPTINASDPPAPSSARGRARGGAQALLRRAVRRGGGTSGSS
jgi:signal transduction histidine kinase